MAIARMWVVECASEKREDWAPLTNLVFLYYRKAKDEADDRGRQFAPARYRVVSWRREKRKMRMNSEVG
jgi:hypothetical protein